MRHLVDVTSRKQVSIVLRFVDDTDTIREEFWILLFGEVLVRKLKEIMVVYGFDFGKCYRHAGVEDTRMHQICTHAHARVLAACRRNLIFSV